MFTPLTIKSTAAIVHLSQGMHAVVDTEDFGRASAYWWNPILANNGKHYVHRRASTENPYTNLHRFVVNAMDGQVVDHWDGNPLNNRKSNLRTCTSQQNGWNRQPDRRSKTGFKGVYFFKPMGKWQAHIRVNDRKIHLGYFADVEGAARAYDAAARKHFGEFARPNFSN